MENTWGFSTKLESFHLSCKSDPISTWNEDLGGLMLYCHGVINGVRFKEGYVYVKRVSELEGISSNEGMIHG